jgi:hypothetical protein
LGIKKANIGTKDVSRSVICGQYATYRNGRCKLYTLERETHPFFCWRTRWMRFRVSRVAGSSGRCKPVEAQLIRMHKAAAVDRGS